MGGINESAEKDTTEHKTRITVELDKELKKKVVLYCAEKEISMKAFLLQLIKEKFE